MIVSTVRIRAQKKCHRKKRINKKWAKKYGTIEFSTPIAEVDTILKLRAKIQFMRGIGKAAKKIAWSDIDRLPNHQDQRPGQPIANDNRHP